MTDAPVSGFRRLLAELVVVFLGVLIALAVDAWWDAHVDARREMEYLNALQEDMATATANLDGAIRDTEGWLKASDRVLVLLDSDLPIPDTAHLMPFKGSHPAIPTGTLDALLSTGDINLIRDRDLRASLISASASIHDLLRQLVTWDEYSMANMAADIKAESRVAMGEGRSALQRPHLAAVRRDPELAAIYSIHQNKYQNEAHVFEALRDVVVKLHDEVSDVLGPR